jgi:hypothetical protein
MVNSSRADEIASTLYLTPAETAALKQYFNRGMANGRRRRT